MVQKRDIRRQVFALRKETTEAQIEEMSRAITRTVLSMPEFQEASRILAYMDYNHEVITRYLIDEAHAMGKEVALPRVCGERMIFYKVTPESPMEKSHYGILEPAGGEEALWEEALMLMPGVAFDRSLHRVGYGGGYYDRYLAEHPGIRRLALAFSFQIFPEVPTEKTDLCPHCIVTEQGILGD